jgi:hypothetical protein
MASRKVAAAYVSLELQIANFKAAIGEAQGLTKKMAADMREQMDRSRESVRLLSEELGLGIPRGLQGIISKLPGITTAMNLAFDAVVVFALIKTVYEVGEKIVEFARKSEEAAKKHEEAWGSIHGSMARTNTELELANAKLEDTNAKLEHKPQRNGPLIAILEAKKAAEDLQKQLGDDIKLIEDALQKTDVGLLGSLFGQKSRNGYEQTMEEQHRIHMRDADTPEARLAEANSFSGSLTTRRNELEAMQGRKPSYLDAQGQTHRIPVEMSALSFAPELENVKDMQSSSRDEVTLIKATQQHAVLQGKNTKLTQADTAAAESYKAMEELFKKTKALWGMSVEDEIQFWASRVSAFGRGSSEYSSIQDILYAGYEARSKQFAEIRKSATIKNVPDGIMESINMDPHEGGDKIAAELAKGYEAYAKFGGELDQVKLKALESTGALTPHAAALAEAALHAKLYAAELKPLNEQLDKLKKETPTDERQAQMMAVGNQISQVTYKFQTQQVTDSAQAFSTSFTGQVDKTFSDIIAASENWGEQFRQTVTGALGDVNNAIIHILTTKPQAGEHPFEAAGKQIFTGVAKTGLQDAEGSLMKGFKLDKIGTSEANPMWVRMAGVLKSAGTAVSTAVSTASSAASSGGFWSGLASMLIPKAGGGLLSPGDFYMTGERGPELLQVGSTSKINNARDTSAMLSGGSGGGVTNHAWNIDARGANDPAATYQAAQRAIMAAAPHIVAATNAAAKDRSSRLPPSRRS